MNALHQLILCLEDDSPYPEVRSAVANFDDPDMPASTLRAWSLGLVWAILISGMNQFFYFRYPSVSIGSVRTPLYPVLPPPDCPRSSSRNCLYSQRVVYGSELSPANRYLATSSIPAHSRLKNMYFRTDAIKWLQLTPSQVLVTIMATVGAQSAYATDILAVQRFYYDQNWSFLCMYCFLRPFHFYSGLNVP